MADDATINDQLVLISGESATGKSVSLMNLENPEGVMYANCEAGKRLPFKSKFQEVKITDPLQIYEVFEYTQNNPDFHTVAIDTLTFMMNMYESVHVVNAANTMAAWGNYSQFFQNLMQQFVAKSDKNVIFLAHTVREIDKNNNWCSYVPVKGSLKNNGIESYFSTVLGSKKLELKDIKKFGENELLTITPQDERLGFKHVFQTQLTKDTVGDRIRAPMGMFSEAETYINNDCQMVMDRLRKYYS